MGQLTNWRNATSNKIAANPFIIDAAAGAEYYPLEENAFGTLVRANSAVPFTGSILCRISKDNSTIPQEQGGGTPQTKEETYYLIAEHDAEIPRDLEFLYHNNVRYRTLIPEKVYSQGEVAYIRCSVLDITEGQ